MGGRGASSSNRGYDGKIQLERVGEVDARKVANLKKGDIIMYNFGSTSRVVNIESSKSGKTYNVTTKSSISGNEYTRKYSANSLVGISNKEAKSEREELVLRLTKGR